MKIKVYMLLKKKKLRKNECLYQGLWKKAKDVTDGYSLISSRLWQEFQTTGCFLHYTKIFRLFLLVIT